MYVEKVEVIILKIQCDICGCLHVYDEVHPPITQPRLIDISQSTGH